MDDLCFQHKVVEGEQMVADKKGNLVVKVMRLMTVVGEVLGKVLGKVLGEVVVAALRKLFADLVDRQDETFC